MRVGTKRLLVAHPKVLSVEEHFVFHAEKILPALAQMLAEFAAMGQEPVEHGVELVLVAEMEVRSEQIAQRGAFIPEAPASPFAGMGTFSTTEK